MTARSTRVGTSGRDRPCSQLRSVAGGKPNFVANCAWLSFIFARTCLTSTSGTWTSVTCAFVFSPRLHAIACSRPSIMFWPIVRPARGRVAADFFFARLLLAFINVSSFSRPDIPLRASPPGASWRCTLPGSGSPARSWHRRSAETGAAARCDSSRSPARRRVSPGRPTPILSSSHRLYRNDLAVLRVRAQEGHKFFPLCVSHQGARVRQEPFGLHHRHRRIRHALQLYAICV